MTRLPRVYQTMLELQMLVFGRIVGQAAADYSAALPAQTRSATSVQTARDEIAQLLAADGSENVSALQRAIRNTITEHADVVRDEAGLLTGLAELDALEARMGDIGVHPDIAGYQDLAHTFDLKSAIMSARHRHNPRGDPCYPRRVQAFIREGAVDGKLLE